MLKLNHSINWPWNLAVPLIREEKLTGPKENITSSGPESAKYAGTSYWKSSGCLCSFSWAAPKLICIHHQSAFLMLLATSTCCLISTRKHRGRTKLFFKYWHHSSYFYYVWLWSKEDNEIKYTTVLSLTEMLWLESLNKGTRSEPHISTLFVRKCFW